MVSGQMWRSHGSGAWSWRHTKISTRVEVKRRTWPHFDGPVVLGSLSGFAAVAGSEPVSLRAGPGRSLAVSRHESRLDCALGVDN